MARRNNEDRVGAVQQEQSTAALTNDTTTNNTNTGAGLSFVVPTEFIEIPSAGLLYPEGHPLHGQSTIEIKHMTAKEEDILTSRALLKKGIAIDRLLQSIIIDKRIKSHEMLVGDKNALMIAARISAYGPDYSSRITCPNCGTVDEPTVDLISSSNIRNSAHDAENQLESVRGPTKDGTYLITLPVTCAIVEVKLMTGADEKKFSERVKYRKKHKQTEANLTDQFKTIVQSINGVTVMQDVFRYIDNLPVKDSRFLRTTYGKLSPTVELKHDFSCSGCGYEQEVEVPITAQFFWPDA